MGRIIILDENTSNKIAAGEVVERPQSVVKELVENAIDAGSDTISVEIKNGGISLIRVIDNGGGMEEDDVEISFERHSTSKIRSADDLEAIGTFGFRGEALASIAAVSDVQLTTRTKDKPYGIFLEVQGGKVLEKRQTGCPTGTSISVRDLFFNTPARYKFLKKDSTEAGYVSDILERMALGNPQISFKLASNGSNVLHTPGNSDLRSVIFSIYGKDTAREINEIGYEEAGIKIGGYVGKPIIARSNRNQQSIFINGRYIRNKTITMAIDEAYKTLLMKNRFAFVVLDIRLNPAIVDVNVHPAKMEVRFSNDQDIFRHVFHAVSNALSGKKEFASIPSTGNSQNATQWKMLSANEKENAYLPHYTQQKLDYNRIFIKGQIQPRNQAAKDAEDIKDAKDAKGAKDAKDTGKASGATKSEPVYVSEPETIIGTGSGYVAPQGKAERAESGYNEEPERVTETKDRYISSLADMKIIGQAFSTYILLQHEERLILLDQHAAHERILYERLKAKFDTGETIAQMLIAPVAVELTHREGRFLEENREFFGKLGFIFDSFGNNSIVIRSIPAELAQDGQDARAALMEVVDGLIDKGRLDYHPTADETMYMIACKAAVKANKNLREPEIREILKELEKMDNPFTCPHGRPTTVEITKYELERMFKRIV